MDTNGTPLKLMEVGVILLLAFLLAIFVTVAVGPLHSRPRARAPTQMIANARSIAQAIVSGGISLYPDGQRVMDLPPPVDYPGSSTEFLAALVTNGYLTVRAGFFGGAGVPMAPGQVGDGTFTSAHNAWRIVAGLIIEDPVTQPLVISRNFDSAYTNLSARVPALDRDKHPFGGHGLVVATVGGSARFFSAKDLASEWPQLYDPATIRPTRILPE